MPLINFKKKNSINREKWTKESEQSNSLFAISNRIQYLLRNGYQLNITTDRDNRNCTAYVSLKYGDSPLNNTEEVNISIILKDESNIKEFLLQSYNSEIRIVFNGKSNKFVGLVIKKLTEGPYCEFSNEEIVRDTKVLSSSFKELLRKMDNILSLIKLNNSSCNNLELVYNNKEQKRSEIMEREEIPFNYFFIMFDQKIRERVIKLNQEKLLVSEEDIDEDEIYFLSKEEQFRVYNDSFYDVLLNYLSLTNNEEIVVLPENPIDLSSLILNDLVEGPYKHSFLMSLQYIIQSYLDILEKGYPTLQSKEREDKEKSFNVIYDRSQRINTFDSRNMNLEEQDEIMIKVLKNTMNGKIELMPSVRYITRTDI